MALEKAKEEFGYEEYNDSDGDAKQTPGADSNNYEDELKALEEQALESDEEGQRSKEK